MERFNAWLNNYDNQALETELHELTQRYQALRAIERSWNPQGAAMQAQALRADLDDLATKLQNIETELRARHPEKVTL